MRETLGFEEVEAWLRAAVGDAVSAYVVVPSVIVAFVDGPIDGVMWFEGTKSRELHVDGGAGAWTLVLAEPQFVSASLATIPGSRNLKHLMIKLRDYWVAIDPGIPTAQRGSPNGE